MTYYGTAFHHANPWCSFAARQLREDTQKERMEGREVFLYWAARRLVSHLITTDNS